MRLQGKVAIVTGATSGIGESIAVVFAREGAKVLVAGRSEARGKEVVDRIVRDGGTAKFRRVDLANEAEVQPMIDDAVATWGKLNVLVNNAAYFSLDAAKPVTETPLELWKLTLAVNITAPFLACKAAIPQMVKAGGGSIINIASIGGVVVFPNHASYTTTKAALVQLTKSVALDYANVGIRANAIAPGTIDTPGNEPWERPFGSHEKFVKATGDLVPIGRIARPEEIAYAAVYYASDESSYTTGTVLPIDGAITLRFP